jgi:hypothetical protein
MFGLVLKMGYKGKKSGLKNLDWIQNVEMTNPNGDCVKFVDPENSKQLGHWPFYLSEENKNSDFYWPKDTGYDALFRDEPSKEGRGFIQSFEAELSLVGLNKNGKYQIISTIRYGFTLLPGSDKVNLHSIRVVPASNYQKQIVNMAKPR